MARPHGKAETIRTATSRIDKVAKHIDVHGKVTSLLRSGPDLNVKINRHYLTVKTYAYQCARVEQHMSIDL